MAGKLQWQLELLGVQRMQQQLDDLAKRARSIGFGVGQRRMNPDDLWNYPGTDKHPPIPPGGDGNGVPPRIPRGNGGNPFNPGSGGGFGGLVLMAAAFKGIQIASDALKMAFHELVNAVQRGASLYTDAAKTGHKVGDLFTLQSAANSVGLTTEEANNLLLMGQFRRSGRSSGTVTRPGMSSGSGMQISVGGDIMGARRSAQQMGQLQQLSNLEDELARSRLDAAQIDKKIVTENSYTLFTLNLQASNLKREWSTLWNELATELSSVLIPAIEYIKNALKLLNFVLHESGAAQIARLLGPGIGKDFGPALGGGSSRLSANSWQRMGLVMQGGMVNDAAHQTAKNTAKLVRIEERKMQLAPRGGGMPNNPNYNYP